MNVSLPQLPSTIPHHITSKHQMQPRTALTNLAGYYVGNRGESIATLHLPMHFGELTIAFTTPSIHHLPLHRYITCFLRGAVLDEEVPFICTPP